MGSRIERVEVNGAPAVERVALSSRAAHGFTLIELLIVIIIIGILAAIAIPMFLNQRTKAKNASVKEGIHSIQVGVQSYAVDNNDIYPAAVAKSNIGSFVDNWPDNPFLSGSPDMLDGTGLGNYTYTQTGGTVFGLVGHLSGSPDFSVGSK